MCDQARRQGGFEGVRANPPFGLQIIVYTALNCVTTALVSLQLRTVQTSLVVATWLSLWRTSVEHACEYVHINTSVNISGA